MMGPWLPLTNPGSKPSWKWLCVIAAALLVLAGAGGGIVVGLMVSYRYPPLQGSWAQGRDDYYDDEDSSRRASGPQQQQQEEGATARSFAAAAAAAAVSSGLDGPHKMQEQRRVHVSVDEATVRRTLFVTAVKAFVLHVTGNLLKRCSAFTKMVYHSSMIDMPVVCKRCLEYVYFYYYCRYCIWEGWGDHKTYPVDQCCCVAPTSHVLFGLDCLLL